MAKRFLGDSLRLPLAGALAPAVAATALAGCGSSRGSATLTVFAAASLQDAFDRYGAGLGERDPVRFSFAGSDALAAQIEQGLRPDVFASANTALPERLYSEGLVEQPLVFATNRLVLAVPASEHSVTGLADAQRAGVKLAIGEPGVPVGSYTRTLLARLPAAERRLLMAKVEDVEPDVSGIVGKLAEGAVDAGFLYVTDVAAAKGQLRAIELPEALRPQVAYAIAVVRGSRHERQARRFIDGLIAGPGRRDLEADGFGMRGGE